MVGIICHRASAVVSCYDPQLPCSSIGCMDQALQDRAKTLSSKPGPEASGLS